MRFRKKPAPTGRQRTRSTDLADPTPKFSYRTNRSDTERGVGRQTQRQAIRAASATASRFWLPRFGLLILLVAAAVSAVNILSLSKTAIVLPLTSDQATSLKANQTAYAAAADRLLADSVWNHNKLTINPNRLSQQLLAQFPELANVSVTVPLLAHRPIFYVQPAQAALIVNASNGTFLIATSGKALAQAASAADLHQPSLPVVQDQTGLRFKLNQQALPAKNVSFIQMVVSQLAAKQFHPSGLILPANTSELDVNLSGQPYAVKFNLQSDTARQQAGTFLATIAQLQQQSVTPAKYVDVRVDGRAYYQ